MHEFRQRLGSDGEEVSGRKQTGQRGTRHQMFRMFPHFDDHEKAGVHPMDHILRSSSISSRRSSSLVTGCKIVPRLTVGMSKTLCGPCPRVSESDGSGAKTVTSTPSGRRTPPSSTTTPFLTWPRVTIETSFKKVRGILSPRFC